MVVYLFPMYIGFDTQCGVCPGNVSAFDFRGVTPSFFVWIEKENQIFNFSAWNFGCLTIFSTLCINGGVFVCFGMEKEKNSKTAPEP